MLNTLNADPAELAKFSHLAPRWWDPNGDCKPLHAMNPVRAQYIDTFLNVAQQAVLDIGCGGGLFTEAMAQRGATVTGLDLSPEAIEVAHLHALEGGLNIQYRCESAEAYAQAHPNRFQLVTCLEMLEHVPSPESIVQACAELVAPGGYVVFSTLNRTPKTYGLAILGAEYLLGLLPKGTHDYHKCLKPSELAQFCRNSGLWVEDISSLVYNPFSQQVHLEPQAAGINYLMCCRKQP